MSDETKEMQEDELVSGNKEVASELADKVVPVLDDNENAVVLEGNEVEYASVSSEKSIVLEDGNAVSASEDSETSTVLEDGNAVTVSEDSEKSTVLEDDKAVSVSDDSEVVPEITPEVIPSMDDFKDEISRSFKKIKEGDILTGTVIGISETEVTLDLRYYTDGIIKLEELSNDPSFSIKADVHMGEEISATVIREDDGQGHILLSRKLADDVLAWDQIRTSMAGKKIEHVKIAQSVNSGVVTFLYGVRAFIPASQLSLSYVEDLDAWVGREIDVIIITANEEDMKLVLSGKEVERDRDKKDKTSKISRLQTGIVTTGTVEKIAPYGAFVNIGEGLSGLLHISQICDRRIKSPSEVIKEGETITVKILDIKDGKISLSMKAVEDKEDVFDDVDDTPSAFSSGEEATTGLAALLKNIKL
ncbi:MAG: S1 RNA-binding domain-containing protein [Mobilitalea sp.]